MSRTRLVVRNVLATVATQLISWVLSFVVTLYLPRYLGDEGMGKFAFAGSFVSIFGVFVTLGLSTVLVREIARDRNRISELLPGALLIQLLLSVIMALVAYTIAWLIGYPSLTRTLIAITSGAMIINTLNSALGAGLQGLENIPRQSVGLLVEKFLSSAIILYLIYARSPLWAIAAVSILTALISLATNLSAFKEWFPALRLPTRDTVLLLFTIGLPFFGVSILRTLYNQVDTTLLSMLTDDKTVGWYALANRLLGSTFFIPVALGAALFPTLAKLYQEDKNRFIDIIQRMIVFIFIVGLLIGLPIATLSKIILLDILHYPSSFANASTVLSIYGIGCVFWYLTQILGTAMAVMDRQREMCFVCMFALILSVVGYIFAIAVTNWLLGNGAIGAGIVRVAVEILITVGFIYYLPHGLINRETAVKLLKVTVAAVPFVAVLLLDLNIALRIGIGIAIFLIACRQLGCINAQDIDLIKHIIRQRRGN